MPHKFRVQWSKTARDDLCSIITYIASENLQEASRQLEGIQTRAESLEQFPERGRIVPELKEQGIAQYRELIMGPWRLIYRIAADNVYVLCFLDARRNLEDILLDRFIQDREL